MVYGGQAKTGVSPNFTRALVDADALILYYWDFDS